MSCSIGTQFNANTSIKRFKEFSYFTGIKTLTTQNQAFQNCTNLEAIDFPTSLTAIGYHTLQGIKAKKLKFPNVTSAARWNEGTGTKQNQYIFLSPNFTTYSATGYGIFVFHCLTPPTISNVAGEARQATYYCPDAAVNTWKAASGWSGLASRIFPLSEFVERVDD